MADHDRRAPREIAGDENGAAARARRPASKALYERARAAHAATASASSFQAGDPYPIYLARGQGRTRLGRRRQRVRRLPRRLRLHGRRPRAPEDRRGDRARGAHRHALRGAPPRRRSRSPRSCAGASGSSKVRFANSGTEATMDAIRIARAATGRDDIVKIEGSYHGHHDTVMFSVVPERRRSWVGASSRRPTPMSKGIPAAIARATRTSSRSTTSTCCRAAARRARRRRSRASSSSR